MKNMTKIIGMISVAFLIAGCQNTEEGPDTQNADPESVEVREDDAENNEDELEEASNDSVESTDNSYEQAESEIVDADEDEDSPEGENQDADDEPRPYGSAVENQNYFIQTHSFDQDAQFYTAFSIERQEGGDNTPIERRLETSLVESDPSEQDIIDSYADLSLNWPNLTIQLSVDGNELSATSAQSGLFFDTLYGVIDYYGIEEVTFLDPQGEENVILAERSIYEPVTVQEERGLTRGYYTVYDKELQETLFLPGGVLEEQVTDENDELLSFEETLDVMATIDRADAFYESAFVDGIEIVAAEITNNVAQVIYSMDEDKVSEDDQKVFENALQFTAINFHVQRIEVFNETERMKTTYPLAGGGQ